MVCLLLLVPSVLGVAVGWSACSRLDVLPVDGEPVGCVACGWGLVAVVVSYGEPVGWSACSQYPRHIASL